ncbi:hypothetical protein ACXWTF_08770 [Thiomicrolovo sp. ZZH C-3]
MKVFKYAVGLSLIASVAIISGCGSSSGSASYGLPVTSSGVTYSDFNGSVIMHMELSSDGKTLYAAVNDSGTDAHPDAVEHGLTILNLSTGTTEHIDTGLMGRYVKLSNDEKTAYVTAGGDDNLSFIDLGTKTVTNSIYIDSYASGMDITADGSKMYIGLDGVSNELAVVDLATETVEKRVPLNGGYGNTVILSADESKVFVSESSGGGLVTYDIAADAVSTITTSGGGYAADFDMTTDETTAYVSLGQQSLGIDIVDMVAGTVSATLYDINATDTFDWVREVKLSKDDKLLFVTEKNHDDTLFIVDLENNNSVSSVVNTGATRCIGPSSVAVSPNGAKVYVGCAEGVIAEFDLTKQ